MEEKTETMARKILNYTKNIVLSLAILFTGLFLVSVVGVFILGLIFENTGFGNPNDYWVLITLTPTSAHSWLILLSHELAIFWPSFAFIVWAVRDSRKFVEQGVSTRPFLWGIGMIFPLIFIFFPLYFIRRNITWAKEKQEITLANDHKKGLASWWSRADFVTENTKIGIGKVWNILKWTWVVLVGLFGILMIFSIPHLVETKKTDEQVAKIHATKLTMDDVVGKNLPPDPGAEADKTIAGIDANENGIRDDVELAIFKEYSNSAKTRAVLLQYALALQMEVVQPFENERNVTAVAEDGERAYACVGEIVSRDDIKKYSDTVMILRGFVENRQLNNEARKKAQRSFYESLGSHTMPRETCDLDISTLPN